MKFIAIVAIICFSSINLYYCKAVSKSKIKNEVVGKNEIKPHTYMTYTPEEQLALKQLRNILGDELYLGPMLWDGILIHVIRTKKGNVEQSVKMMRMILKWRKDNKIDTILDEDFSKYQKLYPYWVDDGARHGGPIATVPVWDIRKIVLSGHMPGVIRYIDRSFEDGLRRVINYTEISGVEITQGIILIDLNGYTPQTHACLACLTFYREFLYHFENYYPQSASDIFFLNTPRMFLSLLEILRPLLSEYTRKNMHIFGVNKNEYKQELLKVIPIENLRSQFGGLLK